jgi:hypothetical protein
VKNKFAPAFLILGVLLSSCASQHVSPRAHSNLESWDRSMVYDPVTKRYYHTQPINESQYDPHFSEGSD